MRVCIEKSTGKLIEAQSGGETQAHLDTLTGNAVAAGRAADSVETKFVTDVEFAALLAASRPAPSLDDLRRAEFNKVGATVEAMVTALWEQVVEGKPAAATELQKKREDVKKRLKAEG